MPKPTNRTRATARAADKEDNVSNTPTIFRRFPRLGSSYQTKLPPKTEDSYQPSRQTPVLLSKDYPDVAQSYVMDETITYSGEYKPGEEALFDGERRRKCPERLTPKDVGI